MNLGELLRSQAPKYNCSACGESMADCGINILDQRGNKALVRVTCARCKDENLLQIVFRAPGQRDDDRPARPTIDEGVPATDGPIGADDLLDLRDLLRDHQGDFRSLLQRERA